MTPHLLERHGRLAGNRENGPWYFAPLVVGDTNECHAGHAVELENDLLDFGRIDVLAARDDHVFDAVGHKQEAVVIDVTHVAGFEPVAVHERIAGGLGLVPVLRNNVSPAQLDFANFTDGSLGVFFGANPHVDEEVGESRGARLCSAEGRRHGGGTGRRLGHAVREREGQAAGFVGVEHARGHSRSATGHVVHGGKVRLVPVGMLAEHLIGRGHTAQHGDAVLLNKHECALGVEAGLEHDGAALDQHGQCAHAERRHVKERRDHERHLFRRDVEVDNGVERVPDEVRVGQHRAFGVTRGA